MRLLDKIIDVLYSRGLRAVAFTMVVFPALTGCSCRESRPVLPRTDADKRPHPDDPQWVTWRDRTAAFLAAARTAVDAIEKNTQDRAAKLLLAREAFTMIPNRTVQSADYVETAKAGKQTALHNNAWTALRALETVAGNIDAGAKVELAEELRDIRSTLDGIEADPFYGK